MKLADDPAHSGGSGEQRLPAVQDDLHVPDIMLGNMFRDSLRGLGDYLSGHYLGPCAPALIRTLIDVAMITGQITSAVYLHHELTQRREQFTHDGSAYILELKAATGTGGVSDSPRIRAILSEKSVSEISLSETLLRSATAEAISLGRSSTVSTTLL
jgi:hypothetical protein